jgi:hypothetical protein
MTDGFYIIPIVLFISIYILWRIVEKEKSRPETEKPHYYELWQKYGVRLKWWALALNFGGTLILLCEILSLRGLHGGALAQWQIAVGVTYLFFVLLPSLAVIICAILFLRFELKRINLKQKMPYLLYAILSITLPILLLVKAELIIG